MLLCIDAGSDGADGAQFRLFYAPVSDPAWLTLKVFFMLLTVVGMGLLGHLLGFHILLCECSVLIINVQGRHTSTCTWFYIRAPANYSARLMRFCDSLNAYSLSRYWFRV